MEYNLKLTKDNYHKAVLLMVNTISQLGLTNLEVDILATMLKQGIIVVNTDTREILRKVLDKGKYTLNNYIIQLKEKGILIEHTGTKSLEINPNLVSAVKDHETSFNLELV